MDDDVSGLRVVITAGASGIGLATAEEFLAGGAQVQICDVDTDALERFRSEHGVAGAWHADVSDEIAVDLFVSGAVDAMGGVDVLVNNAGIAGPGGRTDTLELDAWSRTLDVNVTGTFLSEQESDPASRSSALRFDREHVINCGVDGLSEPSAVCRFKVGDYRPDKDHGDGTG